MFSTLKKLTTAELSFIVPPTISLTDKAFVKSHFKKSPEKTIHWQKAIQLAKELGLDELAQAFNISKKFMEQEVFLSNLSSCLQEEKR